MQSRPPKIGRFIALIQVTFSFKSKVTRTLQMITCHGFLSCAKDMCDADLTPDA
jgi:hypothetical protein